MAEATWREAAPSAYLGCRALSLAGKEAGRVSVAGGNEGESEVEDVCRPQDPGRGRGAWPKAVVQKRLRADRGKGHGPWK